MTAKRTVNGGTLARGRRRLPHVPGLADDDVEPRLRHDAPNRASDSHTLRSRLAGLALIWVGATRQRQPPP